VVAYDLTTMCIIHGAEDEVYFFIFVSAPRLIHRSLWAIASDSLDQRRVIYKRLFFNTTDKE
jgi:hypothetical protein